MKKLLLGLFALLWAVPTPAAAQQVNLYCWVSAGPPVQWAPCSSTNPVQTSGAAVAGSGQIFPITNDMTTTNANTLTGQSIGGLQTLPNATLASGALGANNTSGYIQNVNVTFTDAVATSPIEVWYFNANPSASTCTNDSAFVLGNADRDKVIGVVDITNFKVGNTAVLAQAGNISMGYGLSSATSIFACVVARGTFVITGTTNVSLQTNVLRN